MANQLTQVLRVDSASSFLVVELNPTRLTFSTKRGVVVPVVDMADLEALEQIVHAAKAQLLAEAAED